MDEGIALLCLVLSSMTLVLTRIEQNIPRKRRGGHGHADALAKFFENVLQAMLRHFDFSILKCILIASPGFVKDAFFEYLSKEMVRRDLRVLIENKNKFVLCHSSTGHKSALKEAMADPIVQERISETKAFDEVRTLDEFYRILKEDPDRAFYGYDYVVTANERHAVQTLLLSDHLFRASDSVETRKKYVNLVESVKENGGDVKIFSSLHPSGEQLKQLTGVAAILRFPLPDIDLLEEYSDSDSSSEEE